MDLIIMILGLGVVIGVSVNAYAHIKAVNPGNFDIERINVINTELERLHNELSNMSWDTVEEQLASEKPYIDEISKLNTALIQLKEKNDEPRPYFRK